MANLKPILSKQFLVTIPGVQGMLFTKITKPKESREVSDYDDGSTGVTRKLTGFTSYDNVTLSKSYNPVQDKSLYTWYQSMKAPAAPKFTVTIQPVNSDAQGTPYPSGATLTLTGCEVVSISFPEADRSGTGTAMIDLEITMDGFTFQ